MVAQMVDQEEQELRDEIVQQARKWFDRDGVDTRASLRDRVQQWEAYRAKASEPAILTVEPPDEHKDKPYHWLLAEGVSDDPDAFEWLPDAGIWSRFGGGNLTPEQVYEIGWRYHSPATPDTRVLPSDEAIMEFLRLEGWPEPLRNYAATIRRAFDHFTAPERVEPTDEAIKTWVRDNDWHGQSCGNCVRPEAIPAAVAHFSPTQPAPAFDFAAFISRKMAHSIKAFGPHQRVQGVCDHIRKELLEVEADPADRLEWIDVLLLAIDGAGRSGLDATEIIAGLEAKLAKNEAREWPDWRDVPADKAIEHVRAEAQPAPVQQTDDSVSRSVYESAVTGRQDFRSAYRRERDTRKHLEWALSSFANPANWIDEPGNLQWTAKLHGIVFAEKVLIEANHMVEDCAEPATPNTSIASELEQENASQPATPVQQELTDEEILEILSATMAAHDGKTIMAIPFARALLAKHSSPRVEAKELAKAAEVEVRG